MAIETVFEKINYTKQQKTLKEQIRSECKTDVFAEDIDSVLCVLSDVSVSSADIADGRADYGGKIIYYISYTTPDGQIKKVECGNEFSGGVKDLDIKSGMRAVTTSETDKVEWDLTGTKLLVRSIVTIKTTLYASEEKSALVGGENIVVNKSEVSYYKSLGKRNSVYPIEEEFDLSYPVEEVLSHRADAVITSVQCGVGSIIVDGEVILSLILLQKNQKRDIIRENKTFPFRAEIECEEAMPTMRAIASVKEKSLRTDVSVDEDREVSVFSVSVNLSLEGESFSDLTLSLANDAFSLDKELEIERETMPYLRALDLRCADAVIDGRSAVETLPIGATLFAVGGERAEILEKQCTSEGLKVTGVLEAVGYFKDQDKYFTRKLQTPFEKVLDCVLPCDSSLEIIIKAQGAKGKILTLNEVLLEARLAFNVYPSENSQITFIKGIKEVGEKRKKECALSVYIPTEGEELWSLAKRLGVTPESLIETNKDLCFPLSGKERIVVYRQR